ncbi:hypothetical protein DFS34DRAFT_669688 [Phlyctochytrium arcticum]|nr:hypothetical protein DFS34DRAFT_669688 [Phlyctochytrium arcticum]
MSCKPNTEEVCKKMAELPYTECPWSFSPPIPLSAPLKPWLQIPLPSWVGFGNQGCVQYPPRRRHPTMNTCSLHHSQTAMPSAICFPTLRPCEDVIWHWDSAYGLENLPRDFNSRPSITYQLPCQDAMCFPTLMITKLGFGTRPTASRICPKILESEQVTWGTWFGRILF